MKFKGNQFKKILEKILQDKHRQPITVNEYMHEPITHTVEVSYSYREGGKTKGHDTKIQATQILEYFINYSILD